MADKRYYWLKLVEDYFNSPKIKKLRKIAGGDTYTIIYLKMQLLSISTNGIISFEGIEQSFDEELALKLDEDLDNVKVTLAYLQSQGLIENNSNDFLLPEACKNIGSESESAERVRLFREREKQKELGYEEKKKEPKSNALRQRQHQAKKKCEEKQHIPYIEDYINNKRYNGNYYLVIQRDRFKCSVCGSIENLCVHHIDGYSEEKSENSEPNKMITLCRNCHSNVHSNSLVLDEDLLNSIEYYNEMLPSNDSVTGVLQNSISISNSISKSISNNKYGVVGEEKKQKHKYGEYKHILLTDEELNKLNNEYGEEKTQSAITYLDEYIEMKGTKYKSHYLALKKWVFEALEEKSDKSKKSAQPKSMWDKMNEVFDE